MSTPWRIIDTGPLDPFRNMAFDETLLRGYTSLASPPTLRLYGWTLPSLSLGVAQDPRLCLDLEYCNAKKVPFVRRMTGGGIILHGDEITYSLVGSRGDFGIDSGIASSYKKIASFLIAFYRSLGLTAEFACASLPGRVLGAASTLCFAGREKYDLTVNGRKIGGNAQRRMRDVVFQHGSIPLKVDRQRLPSFLKETATRGALDDAAGVEELLGRRVDPSALSKGLIEAFATTFHVETAEGSLSDAEEALCRDLRDLKYTSDAWNFEHRDPTLSDQGEHGDVFKPAGVAQ